MKMKIKVFLLNTYLAFAGVVLGLQNGFADTMKKPAEEQSVAGVATTQELIDAAENGDLAKVQALLAAGADVNAKEKDGWTALMWASQEGHAEVVQVLLAAKANVNAKATDGRTALFLASQNGHAEVVQLLKQAGARSTSAFAQKQYAVACFMLDKNAKFPVPFFWKWSFKKQWYYNLMPPDSEHATLIHQEYNHPEKEASVQIKFPDKNTTTFNLRVFTVNKVTPDVCNQAKVYYFILDTNELVKLKIEP